jgi:hypothetical protein
LLARWLLLNAHESYISLKVSVRLYLPWTPRPNSSPHLHLIHSYYLKSLFLSCYILDARKINL